ncbi:FHA domain containing protein [Minicystis rosea]|nr:FHA domain containing protein [Minicystis rosea]
MSTYVTYLPAILKHPFMCRFLLAFEAVLSGGVTAHPSGAAAPPALGIEEIVDGMAAHFDPATTPAEFLPWLAQWAATSLRDDWSEATQRAFLAQVVPLYRMRGTAAGLTAVLALSNDDALVEELTFPEGESTLPPGISAGSEMPPHYFQVTVTVTVNDPALLAQKTREIRAIIDREKPAHTVYGLKIQYPAMRIHDDPVGDAAASPPRNPTFGPGIVLGENSVLGTTSA